MKRNGDPLNAAIWVIHRAEKVLRRYRKSPNRANRMRALEMLGRLKFEKRQVERMMEWEDK